VTGAPGPAAGEGTVARNTAFALASQITTALFTAGLTLYLVRALGPDDYGLFALALAVGLLILQPSDLGLTQSTARFVADHRQNMPRVADVFADGLRLKLLVGITVAAALFALASPIADAYGEPGLVWPLRGIAAATFLQGLLGFVTTTFIALRRINLNFRVALSESAVEAGTSVALVALGGGAAAAALGRSIGYGFGAVVAIFLAFRLLGGQAVPLRGGGRGHSGRLARYAGAMFVIDWAYSALTQVDSLVIGAVLGAAQVGIFQAPVRLITPLLYPSLAIAQAVAPGMSRAEGGPELGPFQEGLRRLILLQAAIVLPIVILAEPISARVLGPGYEGSADVLQALAPFIFVSGFAPLLSLGVNYLGEARRRIPIAVVAVLINLGLDLALVPSIGIVGAAIASNLALIFYTGAHLFLCRRLVGLALGPPARAAAATAVAALPMAGILLLLGGDPGIPLMLAGTLAGWASFLAGLLLLGAVSGEELRKAAGAVAHLGGRRSR
jgi:O-antigen/teichoic acid export membrane protein